MSGLSNLGGAPKCPRCSKSVYFAEEAIAKGKKWHKSCLTCGKCKKGLDSYTLNEHEDDIYCKGCFSKNFGPKGYGFAGGAAGLNTNGANAGSYQQAQMVGGNNSGVRHTTGCPRCGKAVYFAEERIAIGKKWHKMCLKCGSCNKLLDSGSVSEHDGDAYCKTCYSSNFGPKGYGFAGGSAGLAREDKGKRNRSSYTEAQAAAINGKETTASVGTGPKCPRCSKTVYFAEEIVAVGKKWHKTCLKCNDCSKTLDPGTLQEHDGMPYCRACYGKNYGPKGYGFAGGSAGLIGSYDGEQAPSNTYAAAQGASVRGEESTHSVGPKCSRCSKTVYYAEEVIACRRKWHKLCLKCDGCNKLLEIGSIQEHDGQPYCRACYGKKFGPKGYGFAGGSAGLSLNRDDAEDEKPERRRPSSYSQAQVTTPTTNFSGAPECPRCTLPVYFAEEVFAIGTKWHKNCLKCNACGKKLDTSSLTEHDCEIYCRGCYGKHFGPKGYGFAGGAVGLTGVYEGTPDVPLYESSQREEIVDRGYGNGGRDDEYERAEDYDQAYSRGGYRRNYEDNDYQEQSYRQDDRYESRDDEYHGNGYGDYERDNQGGYDRQHYQAYNDY